MELKRFKSSLCTAVCLLGIAGISASASAGVEVSTPGVRVQVGTPAPPPLPPPPRLTVIEKERVIVREPAEHYDHDKGKHKGHHKKHKKHKKHDD